MRNLTKASALLLAVFLGGELTAYDLATHMYIGSQTLDVNMEILVCA